MRYFSSIVAGISLSIASCLTGCNQDDVDCQSPPPTLYFNVVDKQNVSLITPATSSTVKLSYPTAAGNQAYITDVQADAVVGQPAYLATSELIGKAQQLNPIVFTLEVDNRRVGSVQLTTYKNNDNCDGWTHPDKVMFNGIVVAPNAQGQYMLVAD